MTAYLLNWLNLLARWFHFTAGVAWIGTSLYFVWLDNQLRAPAKAEDAANGVSGELWSVHGGGFYHNQKYLTGPKSEPLTHDLHWFKWEAYSTWLSGMALMAVVYWAGASSYLIDKSVLDLSPAAAIGLSIATLVVGVVVYEALCRAFERQPLALGIAVYVSLVLGTWGLFHLFGARAAYLHVGAIIGTVMVLNVAHVIIPGQRKMLAQIRAGQTPDPRPGQRGKIRSVHNTYFTLPVLFIMISNHYPIAYGGPYGWVVLALLMAAGALVRHFFILSHKARIAVGLPIAAAAAIALAAFIAAPRTAPAESGRGAGPSYAQIAPIVAQRCAACHSEHPTQPGFNAAPQGVLLDSPARLQAAAARVKAQAVTTQAMPLGNMTKMTGEERALLGAWIDAGAKGP
ncbi:MAG: urate hydroxylase PuuD [Candidatus Eremiobacteraeota bacterium]|nr:urate hydroxylase PuuD [Candidatus Eremiobacteraeota bacterium]